MQQVDLRTSRHPLARKALARPVPADLKCHAGQSLLSPIDSAPPLRQLRAGQCLPLSGRWGLDRLPRVPKPDPFVARPARQKCHRSGCLGSRLVAMWALPSSVREGNGPPIDPPFAFCEHARVRARVDRAYFGDLGNLNGI